MENHPIPQDVTGFQFKLIGTMTLKQFALLGVPSVAAFLLYYSVFPIYVKYPLMFLLGLIGLALAFLPIEGRPADVMIKYFITALLAPNQFLYKKQGRMLAFAAVDLQKIKRQASLNTRRDSQKELQLQTYLQTTKAASNPLDTKEAAFLQTLQQYSPPPTPIHKASPFGISIHLPKLGFPSFGNTQNTVLPPAQSAQAASPTQSTQDTQKTTSQEPQKHDPVTQTVEPQSVSPASFQQPEPVMQTPFQKPTVSQFVQPASPIIPNDEITSQLKKMQDEKERLEQELQRLRQQVPPIQPTQPIVTQPMASNPLQPQANQGQSTTQRQPVSPVQQGEQTPPPAESPLPSSSNNSGAQPGQTITANAPHVSKIPKDMAQSLGLPNVPDSPNLITGLVRDPRGNVLTNMLVEVKDKQGNPVRAFKTNQLGQFASATPLLNGTYAITFEDPKAQHKFDTIEITAKGEIISPISVVSHDAREELRKALFN